jgi:hypothetical protein
MQSQFTLAREGPESIRGLLLVTEVRNLFALFDDGLGARFVVIVLLLDYRRAVRGLTLLDHGSLAVAVSALTNGHASTNRSDTNAHADFFRQSGSRKSGCGRKYQSVFHGYLLYRFGRGEIPRVAERSRNRPNLSRELLPILRTPSPSLAFGKGDFLGDKTDFPGSAPLAGEI